MAKYADESQYGSAAASTNHFICAACGCFSFGREYLRNQSERGGKVKALKVCCFDWCFDEVNPVFDVMQKH